MINDDTISANDDFDDDDSFALENLEKYPGNLSEFIGTTPPTTEVANASRRAPGSDDSSNDLPENTGDTKELSMESDPTNSPNTPLEDDPSFQQNLRGLEGALGNESPPAIDDSTESTDEDTDDFVRQLQADLERSKARKAAQSAQSQAAQKTESFEKSAFASIEDLPDTEEIDLSSIAAHHPSTYQQVEKAEEVPVIETPSEETDSGYSGYAQMAANMPAEPTPAPEAPTPEAPAPTSEAPPKKDKKNRKAMYVLIAACAAILALSFGAYSFYPQLSQMLGSHPVADTTHAKAHQETEQIVHHPPQKNTDMSTAEHVEGTRPVDSVKQLATEKVEEPTPAMKEPLKEIVKTETPKIKAVHSEEPKKQEVVKAEHKPMVKEPKSLVKQSKPSTIARNNNATTTSEVAQQIFTVQVYSSPSKDDADERLTRLKSRNATNASISEQTIRGQKWYRVRFGAFASRDEAESAAKELGFTQCWIDRVR